MAIFEFRNYKSKLKSNIQNALSSHVIKTPDGFSLPKRQSLTPNSHLLTPISQRGFTLIEYLVAITILAALLGLALFVLNPFTQIERGRDAQRRQDIQQVKNALETYYQDNSCYPTEVPFGEEWSADGTVYMAEVPQDPSCNQINGQCYEYISDSDSDCPQWNVVFARLSEEFEAGSICPLSSISDTCVPEGYDNRWACVMSGAVNCQLLAASGFSYLSGTGGGGEEEEQTPPEDYTPPPLAQGAVIYSLGGGASFNPYLKTMTITPVWAQPNTGQAFLLNAEDATSDIVDVKVHLFSDNESQVLTLNFVGGTRRNGYWSGTISADTYNNKYSMAIVARNASGADRCTVLTPGGYVAASDAICMSVNSN